MYHSPAPRSLRQGPDLGLGTMGCAEWPSGLPQSTLACCHGSDPNHPVRVYLHLKLHKILKRRLNTIIRCKRNGKKNAAAHAVSRSNTPTCLLTCGGGLTRSTFDTGSSRFHDVQQGTVLSLKDPITINQRGSMDMFKRTSSMNPGAPHVDSRGRRSLFAKFAKEKYECDAQEGQRLRFRCCRCTPLFPPCEHLPPAAAGRECERPWLLFLTAPRTETVPPATPKHRPTVTLHPTWGQRPSVSSPVALGSRGRGFCTAL